MIREKVAMLVFSLCLVCAVQAESQSLLKGYGRTEWGENVDVVKVKAGRLKEVARGGMNAPNYAFGTHYRADGKSPVKEITYCFAYNQLWKVIAELDRDVDGELVGLVIDNKYHTGETAKELKDAGIKVELKSVSTREGPVLFVEYSRPEILEQGKAREKMEKLMKARENGLFEAL